MVLTIDTLSKKIARKVGDSSEKRIEDIKDMLGDVINDLTLLFRQGSVYNTDTITVTNGVATLPGNVHTILRIYNTDGTTYEVADNSLYRQREQGNSLLPTALVVENYPNWEINLLNFGSTGTITIDYLQYSRNPSIMPEYYEPLIKLGVEAEFHVRYSDIEKARLFASKFDQKMNEIKGYLGRNQSATNRTKSLFEINASQSGNHTLNSTNNDYLGLGLGGYY